MGSIPQEGSITHEDRSHIESCGCEIHLYSVQPADIWLWDFSSATSARMGSIPQEGLITHENRNHIEYCGCEIHLYNVQPADFSSATSARMGSIPHEGLITHEDASHRGDHHTLLHHLFTPFTHHVTSRDSAKQNRLSQDVSQCHRSSYSRPAYLV